MPVYLELFHGRKSAEQEMYDWGSDGPILGPLQYVHTTYANDVTLMTVDGHSSRIALTGPEKDLFFYDGVFYGAWSAFGEEVLNTKGASSRSNTFPNVSENARQRLQAFDAQKAAVSE